MPVMFDESLTEREYPTNRFIEYEASDRWWLDKYGFSRIVPMKGYYRVGYTLVMHPAGADQEVHRESVMPRRQAIFTIGDDFLRVLLHLPCGTEFRRAVYDIVNRTIVFTVEHPDLNEVPDDEITPLVHPTWTRHEPVTFNGWGQVETPMPDSTVCVKCGRKIEWHGGCCNLCE